MSPWVERYRPKCFLDVKGQDLAVEKIKSFVKNFHGLGKRGKKAILFHGPPGTGKTTLAYVAALETNFETFELNASDLRNKKKLQEVLKPAMEQKPLPFLSKKGTKKDKIILVDEVDGISGYYDRGGLPELLTLIEKSPYPVIITANDIWDKKFNVLRRKCELVNLKPPSYHVIKDILICILRQENLFLDSDILTSIAVKAKGDVRAAINDLQSAARIKQSSPEAEIKPEMFDERNKETDIFNALREIFHSMPKKEILNVFDSVNMPIDKVFLWIEENIPKEYQGKELARAYEALSKADVFKGRIYKQQYWRFLVYENILLSYGIAAAKQTQKHGFTKYKKPERVLKIWLNNQKSAKKKAIAEKYAKYAHIGTKRAMKEFPIIKQILQNNQQAQKELKLSEEEAEYLMR